MIKPFAELSRSQQRRRLHESARDALDQFGIGQASVRLINYDFNATFRVEPTKTKARFALRLNVNSARTTADVRAEAAWVAELANEPDILVPTPQASIEGDVAVEVSCAGVNKPVPAVLYSWLDGPDLGERASLKSLSELGRVAARLHTHAESWKRPTSVRFGSIDALLMDEEDLLTPLDAKWFKPVKPVIQEALQVTQQATASVFSGRGKIPIHGDLHVWNLKTVNGQLAVFDFDDAGIGRRLQDLAISAYYLRDRPGGEEALLQGYESIRPLPKHSSEEWEALIAGRNLLLLNAVVSSVTAGYEDFAPKYAKRTADRLKHYLTTGRYEL